jgi:hypothetical protein
MCNYPYLKLIHIVFHFKGMVYSSTSVSMNTKIYVNKDRDQINLY